MIEFLMSITDYCGFFLWVINRDIQTHNNNEYVHLVKKINSLCKASNKTIEIFEYEMNRLINLYVYI